VIQRGLGWRRRKPRDIVVECDLRVPMPAGVVLANSTPAAALTTCAMGSSACLAPMRLDRRARACGPRRTGSGRATGSGFRFQRRLSPVARITGTGEPHPTATTLKAAEQGIYHDPEHPSAVILAVKVADPD
jgi:hypothetical protein